jgi:putative membrane protein
LDFLTFQLVLIHCIILLVGAHYTYAEVPLFDWIRDTLGNHRNDYDKIGHFAQGFVPALLAREVLIRLRVVNGRAWRNFLVVCFCLAVSAFYELIEWWVACSRGRRRTPSWAPRVTSGIPSPTWDWPFWGRCWRCCPSPPCMTGS